MCISTGHFDSIFFMGAMPLFELRNFTKMKDTTEIVGQDNSTEPAQQNCVNFVVMKDISVDMHFYRKC